MPILLHETTFLIAKATRLENFINSMYSYSDRSKILSTSFFNTHKVCPFEFGLISRNAKQFYFSVFYNKVNPIDNFEKIEGKLISCYLINFQLNNSIWNFYFCNFPFFFT